MNKRHYRGGYYEKLPPNVVLVARPSRWGNPFKVEKYGLAKSLELYGYWLIGAIKDAPDFLKPLIGKDLACYCVLDKRCHADILLETLK